MPKPIHHHRFFSLSFLISLFFILLLGGVVAYLFPFYQKVTTEQPSILIVFESPSGTLTPVATAKNTFTLLLRHPDKSFVWFTDRPEREVGKVTLQNFVKNWHDIGLDKTPPNTAITINPSESNAVDKNTLVVALKDPQYDGVNDTLSFTVIPISTASMNDLPSLNQHTTSTLPSEFSAVTLFIDSFSLQSGMLQSAQNQMYPKEVQVQNDLGVGSINANIYKSNKLLATKTN